jgi:hypothetical protein
MMGDSSFLSKRLLCVIVRGCVNMVLFFVLQMKGPLLEKGVPSSPKPASTHSRTITHDSIKNSRWGYRLSVFGLLKSAS